MTLASERFEDLLAAVAAKQPAPGGGAAASMLAAIGAALAEMVVQYSAGKKALAEHAALHEEGLRALPALRRRALELADDDAAAYEGLNELQRLAEDDPQRLADWGRAVDAALDAPHRCLELCGDLLDLCERLLGRSNHWLRSDLAIAAIAAEAAAASAAWNVRVNLPLLADAARRSALEAEVESRITAYREARRRIEDACKAAAGM